MLPLSHPCIHAAAVMLQHSRRSILSPLSRRRIDAVPLTMPYLCRQIHASACMPPFYAAACTQSHSCRSHAAALAPSLSRNSIGAAALMLPPRMPPHFFGRSISLPTSRCRIHAVALTLQLAHCSICAAALDGALCRWKRTIWSAFFNAEHDAGGREQARAGAGRGGAGRGVVFEKGLFWGGMGGYFYVRTYPRKGFVTAE